MAYCKHHQFSGGLSTDEPGALHGGFSTQLPSRAIDAGWSFFKKAKIQSILYYFCSRSSCSIIALL